MTLCHHTLDYKFRCWFRKSDSSWCPPPLQPSLSCSFDGSLKSENGDGEPKWPELPPILNQNEDRRRHKYLRKDYLKVYVHLSVTQRSYLVITNQTQQWSVVANNPTGR